MGVGEGPAQKTDVLIWLWIRLKMIVSADREYVKSRGSKIRKVFFIIWNHFLSNLQKFYMYILIYISTSRTAVLLLARGQKYIHLLIDFWKSESCILNLPHISTKEILSIQKKSWWMYLMSRRTEPNRRHKTLILYYCLSFW